MTFQPAVTESNWLKLRAQGFEHKANIGLPQSAALAPGDLEDESYIADLQREHGANNVKIGHAWNSRTHLPDATLTAQHHLCGVYVKGRK